MLLKKPVTPPGIDPGTFRLVAQRLNHYATPGPKFNLIFQYIFYMYMFRIRGLIFRTIVETGTSTGRYNVCLLVTWYTGAWGSVVVKALRC